VSSELEGVAGGRPPAVRVRGLAKAYLRYARPLDRLKDLLLGGSRGEPFWALREVSFEVMAGETFGIVGRNGSGKSTLLQIVAGTLAPTAGEVERQGRLSALLELGSGFSPEFTGRENARFQCGLLGLSPEEAEARLPGIAAFADIGAFLDQPVRTYSSGMFVRLAFAVAISVEPEVLVVDEALAVGDEAFQRRCYERIRQMQERGATILFVSHSGGTVVDLCARALLLDAGEVLAVGEPKDVVAQYHRLTFAAPEAQPGLRGQIQVWGRAGAPPLAQLPASRPAAAAPEEAEELDPLLRPVTTLAWPSRGATIEDPRVETVAGRAVNVLARGQEYVYAYRVRFDAPAVKVRFGMLLKTVTGFELGGAATHLHDDGLDHVAPGETVEVRFAFRCALLPGVYFLNAGVLGADSAGEVFLHRLIDAACFRVRPEPDLPYTALVDFDISPSATRAPLS
jgi:lipopolysaccharide transport system ATP-binding protein